EPYDGPLTFGPERFEPLDLDWRAGAVEKRCGMIDDMKITEVTLRGGPIAKVSAEQRLIYGWASVATVNGAAVVDSDDETVDDVTLVKAAHQFMMDSRAGKIMHQGRRLADVVESIVFTPELQKALGIDLGKTGWLIGMKIRD